MYGSSSPGDGALGSGAGRERARESSAPNLLRPPNLPGFCPSSPFPPISLSPRQIALAVLTGFSCAAMSTASGLRKKRGSAATATAAAPARAFSLGHGGRSLECGGSNGAATMPLSIVGGSNNSSAFMDGFPFPDGSGGDGFPSSSAWFDAAGGDASSPRSWDRDMRPPGGFMSYFTNQGVFTAAI